MKAKTLLALILLTGGTLASLTAQETAASGAAAAVAEAVEQVPATPAPDAPPRILSSPRSSPSLIDL